VLGLIQFMLILDLTVVNVALPRIQHDLGFSKPGLAWVVNGYVLMAGGLVLLGGRLADVFGRRAVFLVGVGVFALASAACGAALAPAMLVSSRFVQGIGEALAAPAALGLIALLFQDPKERVKALGIWGGIAGLGGTTGTVISGALTDLASWRWIFFINLPISLFALVMVPRLVSESRMVREHRHVDFTGAITGTAGLVAIVDGLLQAATQSWGSWQVLLSLLGGVGLLAAMVAIEARSPAPLIPLRFFSNRIRVVANAVTLLFASAFFTYFFLMTPVRAAGAGLLSAPRRPFVPAVRDHDRRWHRHRHRADTPPRSETPVVCRLPGRRRWVAHDELYPSGHLLRRGRDARDDCAGSVLRVDVPGRRQRCAARGHRPGLEPGVGGAERHAVGRSGSRPGQLGDARAAPCS